MTILETAAQLRRKEISSAELTRAAFASIHKRNPELISFLALMEESALNRAAQADEELSQKADLGPLHGIPVAVKDTFCTRGVKTTCGSKLYENHVPDYDAATVERLHAAGAIIVGKTHMHELAYGITSNNPHFGAVRNPWDTNRIPGGSSGGSGAAVAAGQVFMAMGTDTGGSIRLPASFCGTVGLKPSSGRVSRYGAMPLDYTLDHVGPLTRSVRDAALVLQVIAGFDPRDDSSSRAPVPQYAPGEHPSIRGLRIGWPENYYFERVDPDVAAAVKHMAMTAESLGARIVPVRVPDIAALNAVGRVILLSEASALFGTKIEAGSARRDQFGADVLALFDQGRLLSAVDYVNAQRARRVIQAEFDGLWKQVDCLFTPTNPVPAPRIGETQITIDGTPEDVRLASTRFVRGFNVLGLPALSMPAGLSSSGLPIGLQIIGKSWDEAGVLRVAAALEDATDHHKLRPRE